MLQYARSDTHFLLFIYDHLRLALIDRASSTTVNFTPPSTMSASTDPSHTLINRVLANSAQTCLQVYTKEPYDADSGSGPNGWDVLAQKWNKRSMRAMSDENVQRMVYRAVHEWRDEVAREEDESVGYVMPNRYLFRIVEAPLRDVVGLLRMVADQQQQTRSQEQTQTQQKQQYHQQKEKEVSDVVKRRGKELVKVLKRVVKMSEKWEQEQERRVVSPVSTEREDGASTERLLEDGASTGQQQQRLVSFTLPPPSHDSASSLFGHEKNGAAMSLFARKSRLFGDITFGKKNRNENGSAMEEGLNHFRRVMMKMSEELGELPKVSEELSELPKVSERLFSLFSRLL